MLQIIAENIRRKIVSVRTPVFVTSGRKIADHFSTHAKKLIKRLSDIHFSDYWIYVLKMNWASIFSVPDADFNLGITIIKQKILTFNIKIFILKFLNQVIF